MKSFYHLKLNKFSLTKTHPSVQVSNIVKCTSNSLNEITEFVSLNFYLHNPIESQVKTSYDVFYKFTRNSVQFQLEEGYVYAVRDLIESKIASIITSVDAWKIKDCPHVDVVPDSERLYEFTQFDHLTKPDKEKEILYLDYLITGTNYSGMGLGNKLLHYVTSECEETKPFKKYYGHISNIASKRISLKCGFKLIAENKIIDKRMISKNPLATNSIMLMLKEKGE